MKLRTCDYIKIKIQFHDTGFFKIAKNYQRQVVLSSRHCYTHDITMPIVDTVTWKRELPVTNNLL